MKRIPELDGLRGFAAIAVVLLHAFPNVFFWGWSGVDLFFVLSGYLITRIILVQSQTDGFLRSFYLRRVFRIWPVYYLTLLAVLVVNHFSKAGFGTTGLIDHIFFLQNWQKYFEWPVPAFIGPFGISWSVAVEEQYYLVWPLVILLCKPRCIPFFTVGMLIASLTLRVLLPGIYDLLGTRADGLGLGCLLAWLLEVPHGARVQRLIQPLLWTSGALGGVYAALYALWGFFQPTQWFVTRYTGFSFLAFALVGISILYSGHLALAVFRLSVLRWFGAISYAMYLFHYPLMAYTGTFTERVGITSKGAQAAIMWGLIVGLPAASWWLLECPILRTTKKWLTGHQLPEATGQQVETGPSLAA